MKAPKVIALMMASIDGGNAAPVRWYPAGQHAYRVDPATGLTVGAPILASRLTSLAPAQVSAVIE